MSIPLFGLIADLFAPLVCGVRGHLRGKKTGMQAYVDGKVRNDLTEIRCPRCRATWTRKARKVKAK